MLKSSSWVATRPHTPRCFLVYIINLPDAEILRRDYPNMKKFSLT